MHKKMLPGAKPKELKKGLPAKGKAQAKKKEKKERIQEKILMSENVLDLSEPAEIINDDTKGREVLRLLEKNKILLVARKYEICGIITPLSMLKKVGMKEVEKMTADDIKEPVKTISAEKTLLECILSMESKNSDIIMVESKQSLVGIITAEKILEHLRKGFSKESFHDEEMIETKIDEFVRLMKRGPISVKEVKSRLGVTQDQIEDWMEVLENQNVMKIEKHFGKLKKKDDRNV